MSIWAILGIEETKDKNLIRESYMKKLTHVHPEEDPEGFKELRNAYEQAIEASNRVDEEEDITPLGIWCKKIEEVYSKFSTRVSDIAWGELLNDNVAISIDSREEACDKLLEFLMDSFHIPFNIWRIIDFNFDIKEKIPELYEKFPSGFVDFVNSNISYPDELKYEYFEIDDNKDYDSWISLYYKIRRELSDSKLEEARLDLDEMLELDIEHPYGKLLEVRYLIMNEHTIKAREICESIIDNYPDDNLIVYCMAEVEWEEKKYDEAEKYYSKCLEILPNDFKSKTGLADVYFEQGKLKEAKKIYEELISIRRYDGYIIQKINVINEKLIEIGKENILENPDDIALKFELAWCYYENYKYKECIDLVVNLENEDNHNRWQQYDLLARCYSVLEQYEQGLQYFSKWLDEEINDNEELDEEKQSNKLKRVSYILNRKGKTLYNLNRLEEALDCYDKALENNPKDSIVLDNKCEALNKLHRYEESLKLSDMALEIDKFNAHIYVNRAEAMYNLDYYKDAMDCCFEAIDIYPYYIEPYILKMKIYFEYEEFENVLEVVNQVEEYEIENIESRLLKAKTLRKMEKLDDAENECSQLVENIDTIQDNVLKSRVYYEFSYLLMEQEKIKEAIKYITLAIKYDKDNLSNYYLRAYIYRNCDKKDLALEDYKYTIKQYENNEFAYYQIGTIYNELNEYEKARDCFLKVLEINPEHEYANGELSEVYESLGENQDVVIKYLSKHLEINPTVYHYIHRGIMYCDIEENDKAREDYNKALEINPESIYAYNNIGYLYEKVGQFEEAIKYYKKSIEFIKNEKFVSVYNNIAKVYKILKCKDEALKYYNEGIEKYPEEHKLYYNKAKLLRVMKRYDEAIENYLQGLGFEGVDKIDYYDEIAETYLEMKEYKNSIEWYEKIISENKKHSWVYRSIGEVYDKLEKRKKALRYYKKQLKENDEEIYSYVKLADYYKENDDLKNANKMYVIAIDKYLNTEESASTFKDIAYCYQQMGLKDEALKYAMKAIEGKLCNKCRGRLCYEAYSILGKLYEEESKYELALDCFNKAWDAEEDEDYLEAKERVEQYLKNNKGELLQVEVVK